MAQLLRLSEHDVINLDAIACISEWIGQDGRVIQVYWSCPTKDRFATSSLAHTTFEGEVADVLSEWMDKYDVKGGWMSDGPH